MAIVEWLTDQTSFEEQPHHLTRLGDVTGEEPAQVRRPCCHILDDGLGIKRRRGVEARQFRGQGIAPGEVLAESGSNRQR
jgi:hypothetical protein